MFRVLRSRQAHVTPGYWNGKSQTQRATGQSHGVTFRNMWQYGRRGMYLAFYDEQECVNAQETITNRILNDPQYLQTIYNSQRSAGRALVAYSNVLRSSQLANASREQLLEYYHRLEALWIDHDHRNVLPWFIAGDYFHAIVSDTLLEASVSQEDCALLLTNPHTSFSLEEERAMLTLALRAINASEDLDRSSDAFMSGVDDLVARYYWIPFGYDGPMTYDRNHYLQAIRDRIESETTNELTERIDKLARYTDRMNREHNALITRYALSENIVRLVRSVHTLMDMTDERKEYTFQAHVAFDAVLKNLSARLPLPYTALKQLFLSELINSDNRREALERIAKDRYEQGVLIHWFDGQPHILDVSRRDELLHEVLPPADASGEVRGSVASSGNDPVIRGVVKILHSPLEQAKLHDGEILMTPMTTPEYVPAMRRALAIITDEGGVTCHAAIVSRELGKPCIIGTRIATRVFQDGDRVEIDMNTGIIKKC